MQLSHDILKLLPKTDLHCHFDGSLRLSSVIEVAKRRGVQLFSYDHDALSAHLKYGQTHSSLTDYLYGFAPLVAVLQDADDIERMFYEVCADAAAENVWHLELRYCPTLLVEKGLRADEVVAACVRGAERAEKEHAMSVRQILCGLKHRRDAEIIAELAVQFADRGVVAFDLAGPEIGFPIAHHNAAIHMAKRHHLGITLHAGEATGPENIAEAIHEGSADRIGHGTSLLHDETLLNYVVNHRIGIESCPLSNVHTRSVTSLKQHPLPQFLRRGVRVSINTDNRLVSSTTVTRELAAVSETFNLAADDIHRLLENGFKSAFLPHGQKAKMLAAFGEHWSRLVKTHRVI